MLNIEEQIVLVTGGGRGLGAATVRAFAKQGAKIVINYYAREEKANHLVNELGKNAIALQADVRNSEEVEAMFAKAKLHFQAPITTVVNNALIAYSFDPLKKKDAYTIGWEDYLQQLEGSIKGALNTTQAALADMKKRGFGRIINIGTNLFQHPVVAYHDYTTSKAALLGFTRNMASELGEYHITVNMVSAGLLKVTDASKATTDEVFQIIENTSPLKKATDPKEVADAILFFASPWSRAVTGPKSRCRWRACHELKQQGGNLLYPPIND